MAKKADKQPVVETNAIIGAIDDLCREKKIAREVLFGKIEAALVSAYKKEFGKQDNVSANVDRTSGKIEVLARKKIVQDVEDGTIEIALNEVREKFPELTDYELGDLVEVPAASPPRPQSRSSSSPSARQSAAASTRSILRRKTRS